MESEPSPLEKLNKLTRGHGSLQPGRGMASGVLALTLAGLALLGVIGFHFPAYTSTPELRAQYDVQTLRYLLFGGMVLSGVISVANLVLGRARWLAVWSFAFLGVAQLLGGATVPIGDFADDTPYIGLDFFILDLLGSTIVFVLIEKLFPLRREQPIFRPEWQTDLQHFVINHLSVGAVLVVVNRIVHGAFGWAESDSLRGFVQGLPFVPALLLCILVADLSQYWLHRAYHEVGFLWRFHSVHHSAKAMDWIAGSRQHIFELILTRVLVLGPIFVLGFTQRVVDAYVIVVGFQAVFNHANVSARLGPLRYVIVTPNFHHWHHSRDTEAIDRNYAAHFAFLDYLFGTAVTADRQWPHRYGVIGDYVPEGFVRQFLFPFFGSTESREERETTKLPVPPPTDGAPIVTNEPPPAV
ncbi:MAG: sterol desaturase family protein [Sandaracinus sp.]|nr:sterol desaturase family protein [Sandaracinus sp.]